MLKAKEWKGEEWKYAHAKYDGIRLKIINGQAYSSLGAVINIKIPQIAMMPECIVEGELFVLKEPASQVKHYIAAREYAKLRFSVFAIPEYKNVTKWDQSLEWCEDICAYFGLDFIPYITGDHSKDYLLSEASLHSYEGWVLKNYNYQEWWKLKKVKTIDLIITGIVEGEGKYSGMVGSLVCCTSEGYEVAAISGMTDEQRAAMSFDDSPIGKVVEVAYQYVGAKGRLRHPRFKCFREQKDCSVTQDAELEKYYG